LLIFVAVFCNKVRAQSNCVPNRHGRGIFFTLCLRSLLKMNAGDPEYQKEHAVTDLLLRGAL